jgi:hypothetical protein
MPVMETGLLTALELYHSAMTALNADLHHHPHAIARFQAALAAFKKRHGCPPADPSDYFSRTIAAENTPADPRPAREGSD